MNIVLAMPGQRFANKAWKKPRWFPRYQTTWSGLSTFILVALEQSFQSAYTCLENFHHRVYPYITIGPDLGDFFVISQAVQPFSPTLSRWVEQQTLPALPL